MPNKTLYFLVENFSNGSREAFFEKELPYLSQKFETVYVIPLYPDETPLSFSAPNVKVVDFDYFSGSNRLATFFRHFFLINRVFWYELLHSHDKWFYIRNFTDNLNSLLYKCATANRLEQFAGKDINDSSIFYTYWFTHWTIVLSILKLKRPELKFVSRIHGGDYLEEQTHRTLPFRYFQYAQINKVLPVSLAGAGYIMKKFSVPDNKISVSRLGLQIEGRLAPADPGVLHIVSCSSLIPLKRVHLIIAVLKQVKIACRWTHFGDGPLVEELALLARFLPDTCDYDFKGHVPNEKFVEYLEHNPVSFLMNVSESEGVPVSMMEAIAFGVPIVGTNVGGVSEIVTANTGFLMDKEFDVSWAADRLTAIHKDGKIYTLDYRNKVQHFYFENYFAPCNHAAFAEKLSKI